MLLCGMTPEQKNTVRRMQEKVNALPWHRSEVTVDVGQLRVVLAIATSKIEEEEKK